MIFVNIQYHDFVPFSSIVLKAQDVLGDSLTTVFLYFGNVPPRRLSELCFLSCTRQGASRANGKKF